MFFEFLLNFVNMLILNFETGHRNPPTTTTPTAPTNNPPQSAA